MVHVEIEKVFDSVLVEARNLRPGNIGGPVGTNGDVHLRALDDQRRDVHLLLQRRDDFQPDLDFVRAEQGRRGGWLGAVQDERLHVGGQIVPVVGEAADLDASAGGALDDGLDALADQVLEPCGLHQHDAGNQESNHNQAQPIQEG